MLYGKLMSFPVRKQRLDLGIRRVNFDGRPDLRTPDRAWTACQSAILDLTCSFPPLDPRVPIRATFPTPNHAFVSRVSFQRQIAPRVDTRQSTIDLPRRLSQAFPLAPSSNCIACGVCSIILALFCNGKRTSCFILAVLLVLLISPLSHHAASGLLHDGTHLRDLFNAAAHLVQALAQQQDAASAIAAATAAGTELPLLLPPTLLLPLGLVALASISVLMLHALNLVTASDAQRAMWYVLWAVLVYTVEWVVVDCLV